MQKSTVALVSGEAPPTINCDSTTPESILDFSRVKAVFGFLNFVHTSEINDLYNLYIMLALAYVDPKWNARADRDAFRPIGLNLLKISEMTGIPRETVRRRLKSLLGANLVVEGRERTYLLAREHALLTGAISTLSNSFLASK